MFGDGFHGGKCPRSPKLAATLSDDLGIEGDAEDAVAKLYGRHPAKKLEFKKIDITSKKCRVTRRFTMFLGNLLQLAVAND